MIDGKYLVAADYELRLNFSRGRSFLERQVLRRSGNVLISENRAHRLRVRSIGTYPVNVVHECPGTLALESDEEWAQEVVSGADVELRIGDRVRVQGSRGGYRETGEELNPLVFERADCPTYFHEFSISGTEAPIVELRGEVDFRQEISRTIVLVSAAASAETGRFDALRVRGGDVFAASSSELHRIRLVAVPAEGPDQACEPVDLVGNSAEQREVRCGEWTLTLRATSEPPRQ